MSFCINDFSKQLFSDQRLKHNKVNSFNKAKSKTHKSYWSNCQGLWIQIITYLNPYIRIIIDLNQTLKVPWVKLIWLYVKSIENRSSQRSICWGLPSIPSIQSLCRHINNFLKRGILQICVTISDLNWNMWEDKRILRGNWYCSQVIAEEVL